MPTTLLLAHQDFQTFLRTYEREDFAIVPSKIRGFCPPVPLVPTPLQQWTDGIGLETEVIDRRLSLRLLPIYPSLVCVRLVLSSGTQAFLTPVLHTQMRCAQWNLFFNFYLFTVFLTSFAFPCYLQQFHM